MGILSGSMSGINGFCDQLQTMFAATFCGRWGTGKTAVAVECALRLYVRGDVNYIVANVPLPRFKSLGILTPKELIDCEGCAIVMDEAWMFLESGAWKKAKEYIAYLRKNDCIMLFPSVLPLTGYVRAIVVERDFNGMAMGLPFWKYSWMVDPGDSRPTKKSTGSFIWVHPERVFGFYDHKSRAGEEFHVYGPAVDDVGQTEIIGG